MKKCFSILFFVISCGLYGQSIYPLPFAFNDTELHIDYILHQEWETRTFSLTDNQDNRMFIRDKVMRIPQCSEINTLNSVLKYAQNEDEKCQQFFHKYHSNVVKKILMNDLMIMVFENAGNKAEQIAILFYKEKVIGEIGFLSSNDNFGKFYKILHTIKEKEETKSEEYYLDDLDRALTKMEINRALKDFVALQLFLRDNKKLEPFFKKIIELKQINIQLNEIYIQED